MENKEKEVKITEFVAYFRGSLLIEAKTIEEAYDIWEKEEAKIKNIEIDDIDIY